MRFISPIGRLPGHVNNSRRPSRPAMLRPRLALEALEDRTVLSTLFIVPGGAPTDSTHFLRYQDAYEAAEAGDTIQVEAGTTINSVGTGVQSLRISGGAAGTSSIEIGSSSIGA